jgi:3-oxoacyl-[acyl-carrier-protein] synthase II
MTTKIKMAIRAIGAVGGFGCGVDALTSALKGRPPAPDSIDLATIHGAQRVQGLRADPSPLRDFVPVRVMRRMEHHIRIALLAAFDALGDAERRGVGDRGRLGIVMATGYGATCNSFDFQHLATASEDFSGSPTQFSNSVHNAAAAYLSIALEENGPNHTVSHYDLSVPMALTVAGQWLAEDRVDSVLVGAVDEFSKAQAYTWQQRVTKNPAAASLPAIGEGACFLLLSRIVDGANNGNFSAIANAVGAAREAGAACEASANANAVGAYATIDAVGIGRQPAANHLPNLPKTDLYLIGADGFGSRDKDYAAVLPANCRAKAYPQIYGVLPVGMAFDVAIASLSLEAGQSFASADLPALSGATAAAAGNAHHPKTDSFCCLKLGVLDAYAWATVSAAEKE